MDALTFDLQPPLQQGDRVLLHVCCAPCSCAIIEGMLASGLKPTLYFYNPNIHPPEEYEKRKGEVIAFAAKHAVPFVDADYDPENWHERVKGLEDEPERGARCSVCFLMRLSQTATHAHENGFPVFATSLSISRHKDQAQIHNAGYAAARAFPKLHFWDCNWRAKGGTERGAALAREEGFYRQNYCGCVHSMRSRAGNKPKQ